MYIPLTKKMKRQYVGLCLPDPDRNLYPMSHHKKKRRSFDTPVLHLYLVYYGGP